MKAPSIICRWGRCLARGVLGLVIGLVTLWVVLAIALSDLPGVWVRRGAAGVFAVGTIVLFWKCRPRWRALLIFVAVVTAVIVWWRHRPPANDRDWKPEVAVAAHATVTGDQVTIHNIRHLEYRTETDFTPRYYDKTFDVTQLDSVDLISVYWGSDAIAHVMVSFGFKGKDFVTFSIERRDERGETYSTWRGLFHQYELFYVVADERDVIRVRTNYRQPAEDVYLFRTRMPVENQRRLFLDYIRSLNELAARPAWYNTLADNCTTGVLLHTKAYPGRLRYNWKILLSGYTAEYAYELGGLDSRVPFAELKRLGHVNSRARAADQAENFSQQIREGIPLPAPYTMEEFRRQP
ncbi:MAG: hypothetical protein PCFJNLEI_02561 [Verrucomicrobiae bacterium]|nr:hypothetical protein [Verrucomicrobiae bacterium]